MGRNAWTPAEEAWLRENYPHHDVYELMEMHDAAFPEGPARSRLALDTRAYDLGLRKREAYKGTHRVAWTPERVEWLRGFVPGHTTDEISAEHERVFGTPLNKQQIGGACTRFGVKSGVNPSRFKKGQASPSKGKTWDELGLSQEARERALSTCFKKGILPMNAAAIPVGTERVNQDGVIEVKIAERKSHPRCNDNWRPKHRLVYEQLNGPIPEGSAIVFADGDKRNFDPGNLVAVPKALMATINRYGLKFCDAQTLEVAMNVARLMSARNAADKRRRSK